MSWRRSGVPERARIPAPVLAHVRAERGAVGVVGVVGVVDALPAARWRASDPPCYYLHAEAPRRAGSARGRPLDGYRRFTEGGSSKLRFLSLLLTATLAASACSSAKPTTSPTRATTRSPRPTTRVVRETVEVRDPELERRAARLELRLLEREAQVEDLEARLEETRAEVVRAMAKLRTVASRAEAASGMAEAEVALQSLRSSAAAQTPDAAQVTKLVRQSAAEFDKQNYGGALYLANQAKAVASTARGSAAEASRGNARAGETAFALPIRLKVSSRGNVREGPGTGFGVAFGVEAGALLTAFSHTDEWVRIADAGGRAGWIFRSLVTRP